jgi:hypothetical protein
MILYAQMSSSISRISTNVPVSSLSALIETGVWSIEQAMAYVRAISDQSHYPVALAVLANYVSEDLASSLVREIANRTREVTVPVGRRFYEDRPPDDPRLGIILQLITTIPERYIPDVLPLLKLPPEWQVFISGKEIASVLPKSCLLTILPWTSRMRPINAAALVLRIAERAKDIEIKSVAYQVALRNVVESEVCREDELGKLLELLSPSLRRELLKEALKSSSPLNREAACAIARYGRELDSNLLRQFKRRNVPVAVEIGRQASIASGR